MRTQAPLTVTLGTLLALSIGCGALPRHTTSAAGQPTQRCLLLVRVPTAPSWQDFAFLAAVPAATRANDGEPAAIALGTKGEVPREVRDYLHRYKPRKVYALDASPEQAEREGWVSLASGSADAAACAPRSITFPNLVSLRILRPRAKRFRQSSRPWTCP